MARTALTETPLLMSSFYDALPDPAFKPEFYRDTGTKRLVAWVIDTVLITLLTVAVVPFTAFTALFFLPFLFAVISFLYRWVTIARGSATWGMRFAAVEFRARDGYQLDTTTAFLHTLGYTISTAMVLPQILSIGLMLTTERRQGLTDIVLGTVAMNKAASV
ncbi:MAG: RDD family protein [Pseudomonadota bacterium]